MSTELMLDKIHCGKWEDLIEKIDSNSIDLIVTSPPYNVDLGNNKNKKDKYAECEDNMPYTEYLKWMEKLFLQCNRILKEGGRLCVNIADSANGSVPIHVDFIYSLRHLFDKGFAGESLLLKSCGEYKPFVMMTTIVWDKLQIGSSTAWGSFQSASCPSFPTQFEFIIVVAKGTTKKQGDPSLNTVSKEDFIRNSRALWCFPPETRMMELYGHPAMFPKELPRRCIEQLSYKGDIVLDPFSGAGTTSVVAKELGRCYIGFEMTEQYVERSRERLDMVPKVIVTEKGEEVPEWLT